MTLKSIGAGLLEGLAPWHGRIWFWGANECVIDRVLSRMWWVCGIYLELQYHMSEAEVTAWLRKECGHKGGGK